MTRLRNFLTTTIVAFACLFSAPQSEAFWKGASSATPDATPSAYRTTTQTAIVGLSQTAAVAITQQLGAEFSISIWARWSSGGQGFLWTIFDRETAVGNDALGGGTHQAMSLYWSGSSPATASDDNRLVLTGIDQAGNRFSPTTVALNNIGTAYGYRTEETLLNPVSPQIAPAILLTVQYRSGNIELWATYRGMAPRLLIQQPCTWTGTSVPLPFYVGGSNTTTSAAGSIEVEMPTILPDRSLSTREIAQLADGISPEDLNSASTLASAAIKFTSITDGTTTTSDVAIPTAIADGNTVTLNGSVYTFKTTPAGGNDIQLYPSVTAGASVDSTTDTINATAHGIPNGRRVTIHRSAVPGGLSNQSGYFVVNTATDSFQLSMTSGGSVIDITSNGSGAMTIFQTPANIDNLVTALNALTPNTGGASNASYVAYESDTLIINHRTAGSGGTAFTIATTATAKLPSNARLALAWNYVTDYTGFRAGLFASPGAIRRRTVAWTTPTLGELAPNTQVTGSLRIASWTEGMVAQQKAGVGNLALTGIYTGVDPTGMQLQVANLDTAVTVQGWTSCTTFTKDTSAKTFTCKVTVPKGKRWLSNQTRKLGLTQASHASQVAWGVGENLILMGRSLMCAMINEYPVDFAVNGFYSRFVGIGTVNGSSSGYWTPDDTWHRFASAAQAGPGEATMAERISNDIGVVVGMVSRCVGGQSFASLTTQAVFDALIADLSNSFTDTSLGPLASFYLWMHSSEPAYEAILDSLYSLVTTNFGNEIILGVGTLSNARQSGDPTLPWHQVRNDQTRWLNTNAADPRIIGLGYTHFLSTNTTDGIHPNAISDMKVQGELFGLSIAKKLGSGADDGLGPKAISATRSGANIDVVFDLNGATSLAVPFGGDVSGFDVTLASNNFTAVSSGCCVAANTSTDRIAWTSNPLNNDDPFTIRSTNTVPAPLATGTTYYVINRTASDFQLAATVGGAAIDLTTVGSGTVTGVSNRDLLPKSSVSIISANTVRIVLATAPGAPVAVNLDWGRPGRLSGEPSSSDSAGRTAMTDLWPDAQANILVDDFPLLYENSAVPGRKARVTIDPIVSN